MYLEDQTSVSDASCQSEGNWFDKLADSGGMDYDLPLNADLAAALAPPEGFFPF